MDKSIPHIDAVILILFDIAMEHGEIPQKKFTEIELDENEFEYLDQVEALEQLIATLQEKGLYKEGLIFCGIEGKPVRLNQSFQDRPTTFALTEDDYRTQGELHDRLGQADYGGTPLQWALAKAEELPALAVFDSEKMELTPLDEGYGVEYRPIDGLSMDDTAVAVIYFK